MPGVRGPCGALAWQVRYRSLVHYQTSWGRLPEPRRRCLGGEEPWRRLHRHLQGWRPGRLGGWRDRWRGRLHGWRRLGGEVPRGSLHRHRWRGLGHLRGWRERRRSRLGGRRRLGGKGAAHRCTGPRGGIVETRRGFVDGLPMSSREVLHGAQARRPSRCARNGVLGDRGDLRWPVDPPGRWRGRLLLEPCRSRRRSGWDRRGWPSLGPGTGGFLGRHCEGVHRWRGKRPSGRPRFQGSKQNPDLSSLRWAELPWQG